uniref:3-ketoacyl-[acyl-carrier-protein] reductase beta subunit n=1 Tax=Ornithorhynchus anatinus TaxID=9258 RepID=A0A6I8MZY2_ORNAN
MTARALSLEPRGRAEAQPPLPRGKLQVPAAPALGLQVPACSGPAALDQPPPPSPSPPRRWMATGLPVGPALPLFAVPPGPAAPRGGVPGLGMERVCAIFGGSRGIGKAVAQAMAPRGYGLAIVARDLAGARDTARELGGDHLAFSCDVAKEQDVQKTFEEIEKKLGRVNFLVNAAGINRDGLLLRTKTEDMVSQLHTNLLGSMLTCKAAIKNMIQQEGGSIVNIGSVVGLKGNSGQSVYSASKGGLVGFSRSLAKEVARKKIRVNVVAPGFVHTDMTADLKEDYIKKNIPLGRWARERVNQPVVFIECLLCAEHCTKCLGNYNTMELVGRKTQEGKWRMWSRAGSPLEGSSSYLAVHPTEFSFLNNKVSRSLQEVRSEKSFLDRFVFISAIS